MADIKNKLRMFGGPGLFSVPISTSNLYAPQQNAVIRYLDQASEHPEQLELLLRDRLCKYHDARYVVLFSTGFWALVASIKLRAIPGKTQVIIPSLTYRRLADVVYWAGLVPVFVDIESTSLAISPAEINSNIGSETALILAVHPIVNCCDVGEILKISEISGIPVIFDAVESVHETHDGKRIGSFGVGEVFSMHASKLINGLEGGYVCTNDAAFAEMLESFRQSAPVAINNNRQAGLNALLNIGHVAFALAGLDEIDENVAHNLDVYRQYQKRIDRINGIELVAFDEKEQTSYKNIVVEITKDFPINRDKLVSLLNSELVLARPYYSPALHKKNYKYPVDTRVMENTDFAESRYVNLPCGFRVDKNHVDLVCDLILYISENSGALPDDFNGSKKA